MPASVRAFDGNVQDTQKIQTPPPSPPPSSFSGAPRTAWEGSTSIQWIYPSRGVEWRKNELVKRHVKDTRGRELCLLWMSFRHHRSEY